MSKLRSSSICIVSRCVAEFDLDADTGDRVGVALVGGGNRVSSLSYSDDVAGDVDDEPPPNRRENKPPGPLSVDCEAGAGCVYDDADLCFDARLDSDAAADAAAAYAATHETRSTARGWC
jgi:hypothetical protein